MTTTAGFILYPGASMWRLRAVSAPGSGAIDVPVPADAAPQAVAAVVADALRQNGYGGEGILLAIPSTQCLCAPVSLAGLPGRNLQQAMVYRLEEKLPVAAEDVVADFIVVGPAQDQTLGVCAQLAGLAPLVEALEASGIAVTAICPAALLTLQSLFQNGPLASGDPVQAVVLPTDTGNQLELFILRDRCVHGWFVLTDEPRDLLLHLMMELNPSSASGGISHLVAAFNVRPEILAALSASPHLHVAHVTASAPIDAATLARSILAGKVSPWIDLRRDALAAREPFRQIRMPLLCAATAIVAALLCLCGAMLWRANRYERMAGNSADEQQAVFRSAFPAGAIPVDVHSRLVAEEKSLRGLSGDASAAPLARNGLVTLRDLLTHLPADGEPRYRVLELRLDNGRFTLEGQAAAHGDADLIAAALRRGGGFDVEPPRTEQLPHGEGSADSQGLSEPAGKGVAFTITGTAAGESSPIRTGAK